ncbi:thioredoxin family protein [Actinoplanes sp. NPDC051411]|uniref:thioredoxin family protein n=1 Tax=Actinoplanes sp. NPDC051411 TaxID=3155522 RepID=UPI00341D0115
MDPVGIGAVVLALAAGAAGGAWWKRANGRLRDVAPAGSVPSDGGVDRATPVDNAQKTSDPAALLVPTQDGVGGGRRGGEPVGRPIDPGTLAGLGVGPGEQITLLQFSSAVCAPCRAVSRLSAEVAGEVPGVRHVEVDAEEHLDAVKTLGIWRTPTLLVLDREGRIVKRATGVPRKPQLIAAVRETL